jgi:Bacterial protein of unknown function (DUF899)
MLLEPLGQHLVGVHPSHPPVATCHPYEPTNGAGVTEPPRGCRTVEENFRMTDFRLPAGEANALVAGLTSSTGTDWPTYKREGPGMSAFALEDGVVYHIYSAYARGIAGSAHSRPARRTNG